MADFQVVTHVPDNASHLGGCSLCAVDQRRDHTGRLEPMVDTGVNLDFGEFVEEILLTRQIPDSDGNLRLPGRYLVFCESCGLEIADKLGCATPKQAAEWRAEREAMVAAYAAVVAERDAAQAVNKLALPAVFGPPGDELSALLRHLDEIAPNRIPPPPEAPNASPSAT